MKHNEKKAANIGILHFISEHIEDEWPMLWTREGRGRVQGCHFNEHQGSRALQTGQASESLFVPLMSPVCVPYHVHNKRSYQILFRIWAMNCVAGYPDEVFDFENLLRTQKSANFFLAKEQNLLREGALLSSFLNKPMHPKIDLWKGPNPGLFLAKGEKFGEKEVIGFCWEDNPAIGPWRSRTGIEKNWTLFMIHIALFVFPFPPFLCSDHFQAAFHAFQRAKGCSDLCRECLNRLLDCSVFTVQVNL